MGPAENRAFSRGPRFFGPIKIFLNVETSCDIKKKFLVINHAKNMRDKKNVFFFKQDPDPGSGF
jgi:hypothetical protein